MKHQFDWVEVWRVLRQVSQFWVLVTRDPAGKALKDVDWLVRSHAVTVLPRSLQSHHGKC
jgi:hypothetical protein